jgi:hypothetical protein
MYLGGDTMADEWLVQKAYEMLRGDDLLIEDARLHPGNTAVGGVLQVTCRSPRWATELAVQEALARLRKRPRRKLRPVLDGTCGVKLVEDR